MCVCVYLFAYLLAFALARTCFNSKGFSKIPRQTCGGDGGGLKNGAYPLRGIG